MHVLPGPELNSSTSWCVNLHSRYASLQGKVMASDKKHVFLGYGSVELHCLVGPVFLPR